MFLSAVWALILTAPIHCRGSIGEQVILHFSKSVLMKKQINLHLGWPQGEYIFVNYSFKSLHFSTSSTQKNILFIDMNIKCLFIQMFICNRCRLLSVHSSFNSTERRIKWIMRSLHTHGDTFYEVHIPVYLDTLSNAFQHHLYEHSLQASTLTKLWGIDQTFH